MADRLRAHLPNSFLQRVAIFVLLGLAATATLTYAAGRRLGSAPGTAATAAPVAPIMVPDVQGQAFVFAKGTLEDAGFAWKVSGSVRGFAANTVTAQSPAAGTKVIDTGAPLVVLTLKRNGSYPQAGAAEDLSPYTATALLTATGPARPAATTAAATTTPAATTPAATTPAPPAAAPAKKSPAKTTWPQNRPAAFTVPGARTEPLDEMPLPNRAQQLSTWLGSHPKKTNANVKYWLYQNEWIVTGAKFGWWRGAEALSTLVSVDRRAQTIWGIGAKSALHAQRALSEVQSKSK
jgi:PASTA domain